MHIIQYELVLEQIMQCSIRSSPQKSRIMKLVPQTNQINNRRRQGGQAERITYSQLVGSLLLLLVCILLVASRHITVWILLEQLEQQQYELVEFQSTMHSYSREQYGVCICILLLRLVSLLVCILRIIRISHKRPRVHIQYRTRIQRKNTKLIAKMGPVDK